MFTVDIAIENIYIPCTLEDDSTVLGLHHVVKETRVWIWYSKKVDMHMWSVLDNKITKSNSKKERLFNEDIMEVTMKVVEDNWLIYVSQNLEIINNVWCIGLHFVSLVGRRRKGKTFDARRFNYQYQYCHTEGGASHLI
jgi:hypothetical protein